MHSFSCIKKGNHKLMKERLRIAIIGIVTILIMTSTVIVTARAETPLTPPVRFDPTEKVTSSEQALQFLQAGNRRFVTGEMLRREDYGYARLATEDSQYPFAVILACSDSRVSPEILFDQGIGDIFVIRNAGNIADTTALGSLEYAVEYLGVSLIVVKGHEHCGAVSGAFSGKHEYPENLKGVLKYIAKNIAGSQSENDAILMNIAAVTKQVKTNSIVQANHVKVIGAYYDFGTGVVTFIE